MSDSVRVSVSEKRPSGRAVALGAAILFLLMIVNGSTGLAASGPTFGTPVRLPTFQSCGG